VFIIIIIIIIIIIVIVIVIIILISLLMIYLQNCIEQPFESQYVRVARNNEFAEEFLFNIRVIFQSLDTRMSMYPIWAWVLYMTS